MEVCLCFGSDDRAMPQAMHDTGFFLATKATFPIFGQPQLVELALCPGCTRCNVMHDTGGGGW